MEISPLNLVIPNFGVGPIPTIQAAVNQAAALPPQSDRAAVWIPSNYPGNDTYTNPSNVPVFDLRNGGSISFANGALLPNMPLVFSPTPSFNVAQSASYSMTLTGSVTSSSTIGAAKNGNVLSLTLIEDGTGGWTFAFPANFALPTGYAFDTAAGHTNALTFKFDGTNWNLISNSGSGGGTPVNPNNSLQKNNSGVFGSSSITDTGALVTVGNAASFSSTATVTGLFTVNNDSVLKGPNPYIDVRAYGVRALTTLFSTTGSINSGSPNLTLAAASSFINGDGITVTGAGATPTITTPSAPTVVASNSLVPGTGITAPNSSGSTTYQYQIVAIDLNGGATVASAATSISNGAATLGFNTVNVSSWTRSNGTVTVTTSAPHNIVVNSMVSITTDPNIAGTWQVATVPDNTHFTFTTSQDTRNSAVTSGGAVGVVNYYTCNHITWTAVTGAWKYLIYGRTAGSMALIGVSLPENTNAALHSDPLYDNFDDFGATMSAAPTVPAWYPTTPPVSVKNQDLTTTIVSGAGTVNVVLAANAGNTVAGAAALFDNAPNILAAAKVAAGVTGTTPGVLFFPQVFAGAQFFTSSILNISFFPQTLSVMQAGTISLGDTLILGQSTWTGDPKVVVNGIASGGFEGYPTISTGSAIPMIYSNNRQRNMSYVALTAFNGNAALLDLNDFGGGIPNSRYEHVSFVTSSGGTNDCTGRGLIYRSNINGGSNTLLKYLNFEVGTCPNVSNVPVFQYTQSGQNFHISDISLYRRGWYFGGGFQGTIDNVYCQGCQMPKFILVNSIGGNIGVEMDFRNSIEDTTQSQIIAYFPGQTGYIRFISSNGTAGFPQVSGPGGIAISFEATGVANALYNQNMGSRIGPIVGTALDGTLNNGSVVTPSYPEVIYNMGIAVGTPFKVFVNSLAQPAPTCAVSAGGTVTVATHGPFTVAPVFADGGEGTMSLPSATCTTTSGNQTITISWTPVTGAIGYDLYENGNSFQNVAPWVNGLTTSYVWSGAPQSGHTFSLPGSGPTSLNSSGVNTQQIKMSATNGGGTAAITMPTATANRTQNLPDASGNILLDSTVAGLTTFATPTVYDNFNRANGAVGSNWTSINAGTFNVSGNQFIANTAGNNGAFWNANTYGPDQFAEVTIGIVGQNGAAVRMSAGSNYYTCYEQAGALVIQKLVGGSFTNLTSTSVTPVTGDVLRAEAIGTTINCWRNGVLALTATDSALAAGQPGIYSGSTTSTVDNWTGGTIHPIAKLDAENDWTQNQHFTQAITVGNTAPIPGALTTGTIYATSAQLSGLISTGATPPACTSGTAGGSCLNEGTAPTNGSGSIAIYADSVAHELKAATNGTSNYGLLLRAQPGFINQTSQTASIATATLCAASPGACNIAGQYHVSWNVWGSGTACSNVTAGSVSFNLTWTDEGGTAHTAVVMPMTVQTGATTTAIQSTMPFQTALANEGGSGDITLSSNGAAAIQYSTTYTGCTTGTGSYNLRATVTRLQ